MTLTPRYPLKLIYRDRADICFLALLGLVLFHLALLISLNGSLSPYDPNLHYLESIKIRLAPRESALFWPFGTHPPFVYLVAGLFNYIFYFDHRCVTAGTEGTFLERIPEGRNREGFPKRWECDSSWGLERGGQHGWHDLCL